MTYLSPSGTEIWRRVDDQWELDDFFSGGEPEPPPTAEEIAEDEANIEADRLEALGYYADDNGRAACDDCGRPIHPIAPNEWGSEWAHDFIEFDLGVPTAEEADGEHDPTPRRQ